jgi:hypothetical protein
MDGEQRAKHRAYMREYMRARRAKERRSWKVQMEGGKTVRVILSFKEGRVELCGGSRAVEEAAEALGLRGVEWLGKLKAGRAAGSGVLVRVQALLERMTARGAARPASGTGSRCRRRVPRGDS